MDPDLQEPNVFALNHEVTLSSAFSTAESNPFLLLEFIDFCVRLAHNYWNQYAKTPFKIILTFNCAFCSKRLKHPVTRMYYTLVHQY